VKGPEFSENAYSVELEHGSISEDVADVPVDEAAEVAPEPAVEKPAEAKPAHKPRGPKPKKTAEA
jgi:hypothetical protein